MHLPQAALAGPFVSILSIVVFLLPSTHALPHSAAAPAKPHDTRATAFTHPGLLHTAADFERITANVNAKKEPWYSGWQKLAAHADPDYVATPEETVVRDSPGGNYPHLYHDAAAAYALAVYWKVTGDSTYADTAAAILDAWSAALKEITGASDKFLASGIYGYQLANAAEILRDYEGWDGFPALVDMLVRVFYPMNRDFMVRHNDAAVDHYWANWELCNLATMEAVGILSDNSTMFYEALHWFQHGEGNGALLNTLWKTYEEEGSGKVLAQGQEAGRDQGHSMLDFALLGVLAQQAYNQGDDVFGYSENLILAGAEYAAKYNLGNDVPYTTYTNSDETQTVISANGRGNIRPAWELLYAHYGVLKGLDAEWTRQYRDMVVEAGDGAEGGGGDYGSSSGGFDQLGFGTLLFRLDE
ncbi:uncharacterized protein K452DRAFT_329324 [Aplosporella prunicola CBS 121167]|uniref:Alginate lyase domain-containing protein n=1 Tax=Aplosporella prunicola CBS 121167 TaxID=1176127 RepID=A0A6A6B0W1_9PEZI|nr:uncharacterized protein K452DRAFT_329324 [Aplosporella prunicola CBS 121167]KAF2137198.1 hypothetical protein K452DRAFT_329324 [Aplosporella prunicola CBS 121167]